jgi:ABC-2 type transport system ATP-binding protein
VLALTRLAAFRDRRADALSGGMYKKLALACALLHELKALLRDEPTTEPASGSSTPAMIRSRRPR